MPGSGCSSARSNPSSRTEQRFPDFDDYLRMSMRRETELFFDNIIRDDRSILDLLVGKYTFLNGRLANFYGIPGVEGPAFRRVDLTGTPRGGILTQASVLTVTSYANRTSPVLRGKWILENILNAPPPAPPPGVPNLDVSTVGSDASLRQQLEAHRKNPTCAACHARMDPLGFGLENFDAIGAWRDNDGKIAIDASGSLPDGRSFQGPDGLKDDFEGGPRRLCAVPDRQTAHLRAGARPGALRQRDRQNISRSISPQTTTVFQTWCWRSSPAGPSRCAEETERQ